MQLLPYKNEFLINMRANNYSPKTVKHYDRDLAYFEAFLEIENIQFKSLKKIHITLFKSIVRTADHIKLLGMVDKYWTVSNTNVKNLEKPEFHEEKLELEKIEDVNTPVKIFKEFKVPSSSISSGANDTNTQVDLNQKNLENSESKYNYASENGSTVQALSTSSINRMLSAFRSYLKFLEEFDYFPPLSSDTVKLLKKEKKESQIAEYEELIKLIEAPTTLEKKDEIALRNRAMLELLFSTGMRISELLTINREQLTLGKENSKNPVQVSRIYILGKGKKQRFVYLTDRAKMHLENYLKFRDDKNPALFIQYKNKRMEVSARKNVRIKADYLQKKIIQYRKQLGIIVPTSAHSLRHGFATYLIEKGANTAAVQILLGHESLATTTRYVHASDKFAEKTHKDFHPLK